MAELLKVYPKDVCMVIEIPVKEMEALLDYMDRAIVAFNKDVEPDFQKKVDQAVALIKSLDKMCSSIRNFENVS
jgi:hypothetical protein